MAWEVEYTDQFEHWWNTLTEDEQDHIAASVQLLSNYGPSLGRPAVDHISSSRHPNMKELRALRRTSDNHRQRRTNLMAENFNQLAEPIHDDPVRAARVAEYREETLREIVAYQLAELRRDLGIDQSELAERLGMSQAGISKLEHSADPKLSTLRKIIEALGGTLVIQAEINGRTIDLSHGSAA